ncbi:MAG: hypothetical protein AAF960_06905 [Bacteroidota bacterium]
MQQPTYSFTKWLSIIRQASLILAFCSLSIIVSAQKGLQTDAEKAYFEVLQTLSESLLRQQNTNKKDPEFGGILDPENDIYYTRAAEAVYPFTVMFQRTGDQKYLDAAIQVTDWLITKQEPTGQWVENPWEWDGTTADQLLMMALAYPTLRQHIDKKKQTKWVASMRAAGLYLVEKMNPDYASLNYVPTSAATMAALWQNVLQEDVFLNKAKKLAMQTVAKMDEDYFTHGEAARAFGVKYGVDLGYHVDMSLWGLTMYARITKDKAVEDIVRKSLAKVVHFVYPNGIIDSSWGARSYKWTGYGTKTADGSQVLFSMFANENPAYQTAALRNLDYLKKAIKKGLVGYGRDVWAFASKTGQPNLYPTFAQAKNLAMALEFGHHQTGAPKAIPADEGDWVEYFPTIKVGTIRKGPWMATVSAYDYHDYADWGGGKYTHFPRGGAILNLWLDDFGLLTTASQTKYHRGEEIHMPPIEDTIIALTPRIEYHSADGFFTNLYETKTKISIDETPTLTEVNVSGELCNQKYYPGGIGYRSKYLFDDQQLTKKITLRYHDRKASVRIVEPIVLDEKVKVEKVNDQRVKISNGAKTVFLTISGNGQLQVGENVADYWFPFPGLRAYLIVFEVTEPQDGFTQTVELTYTTK